MSDLLETKKLAFIQIEYYDGVNQTKHEPILKQCLTMDLTDKKTLLVDDISDSGSSLSLAKKHLQQQGAKEIRISVIYVKPTTATKPDYYEKQTNEWVVFPWDTKETIREIIDKQTDIRLRGQEVAKLVKAGLPKHLAEKFLKEMQ